MQYVTYLIIIYLLHYCYITFLLLHKMAWNILSHNYQLRIWTCGYSSTQIPILVSVTSLLVLPAEVHTLAAGLRSALH